MGRSSLRVIPIILLPMAVLGACEPTPPQADLPHFIEQGGRHALIVDGSPFLILGAQANNSSNYPSALEQVWPAVVQLHANTLEGRVIRFRDRAFQPAHRLRGPLPG